MVAAVVYRQRNCVTLYLFLKKSVLRVNHCLSYCA